MGIIVAWKTPEKTCITLTYRQPWTWAEFRAAYDQVDSLFKSVEHQVDMLIDIREGGYPPPGALSQFQRVIDRQHPTLGIIVVVGFSRLFRDTLNLFAQIYRGRYRSLPFQFAATIGEAERILSRTPVLE